MKRTTILALAITLFPWTVAFCEDESPEPSSIASFQDLVALLNRDGVAHHADEDTKFVSIPAEKGPINGMLGIRWDEERRMVHFIQPITLKLSEEQLPFVEASITRINHGLPYPGLGMNHDTQTPYFRMTIPLDARKGMSGSEVRSNFSRTLSAAAKWQPMLQKVVDGSGTDSSPTENGSAGRFPVGVFVASFGGSEWELNFKPSGSLTLLRDRKSVVDSRYETRRKLIRFTDRGGVMAVEEPGTYQWKYENEKLSFHAVDDPSEGRKSFFATAVDASGGFRRTALAR